MSWLGGSLSSLTGQLSNLTKDILTEGTEEVSDHVTELHVCQGKLKELDVVCITQKVEIDGLKLKVREWQEKAESSELQINSISREYRKLLEEKEGEIKQLKQHQHEQQELRSAFGGRDSTPAVLTLDSDGSQDSDDFEHVSYGGDEHDFGDSVAMQHDINRLRGELHRLQGECKHWKSLVKKQIGQSGAVGGTDSGAQDDTEFIKQMQDLEQQVAYEKDQRQHEVASLQDSHNHKLSTVRRKHREEVAELQRQLQELNWGSDGWQEQTPSDVTKLHETVARLQEEVSGLRLEREQHLQQIATLSDQVDQHKSDLAIEHAQTLHLQNQLKVSKEEISHLETDREQVCLDLYETKQRLLDQLDANHADTLEVLSDLRQVRLQLDKTAIERRNKLLLEKDKIVNEMIVSGKKKQELSETVATLEVQHQVVSMETEAMVGSLGDQEQQKLTAGVMDSLEHENLMLKKDNVHLQEQVALLERAVQTATTDRPVTRTDTQIGDADYPASDSGSLTSDLSELSQRNLELDAQVINLKAQISQYESDIEQFDTLKSDWMTEKEALEDVLLKMREQLKAKEQSLNILEAQKALTDTVLLSCAETTKKHMLSLSSWSNSDGLLAVERQAAGAGAVPLPDVVDANKSDSLADIADDVMELDSKIEQLTELNAQLEIERDTLLVGKSHLEKELEDLRSTDAKSQPPISQSQGTSSQATDLNQLLKEKEQELQSLMMEKEDLEKNLSELPDLKQQLQLKQEEVESLIQSHSEGKVKEEMEKQISELKRSLRGKNEEIVNLSLEKEDMMSSLEELDNQNQEAMGHLLQIKDQLAKSNEQLKADLKCAEEDKHQLEAELNKFKTEHLEHQSMASSDSNELNHEIAELKEENSDLRQTIVDCNVTIEKLTKDVNGKDEIVSDMKAKLTSSASALNDLHMDKKELQDKISKLKDDVHRQTDKIKHLRQDNEALRTGNSQEDQTTKQEKSPSSEEFEEKIDELTTELEFVKDSLVKTQNECKKELAEKQTLEDLLKAVKDEIVDKDTEMSVIKNQLLDKENTVKEMETEVVSLRTDCKKLNDESERKHEECESFSRQLHSLENQMTMMKLDQTESGNEISELLTKIDALKKDASDIHEQLNAKSKDLDTANGELVKTKDLLEDTTLRLHSKCEECNELMESIESYKEKLKKVEEQDQSYDAHLMSATGELVLLKEELEYKTAELDQLHSDMNVKVDEISKLTNDNNFMEQELNHLKLQFQENTSDYETNIKKLTTELKDMSNEKEMSVVANEMLKSDFKLLKEKLDRQTKHYEAYVAELKHGNESGVSDLQEKHSELLEVSHKKDLHITELEAQLKTLKGQLQECSETIRLLRESNEKNRSTLDDRDNEVSKLGTDLSTMDEERKSLEDLVKEKAGTLTECNLLRDDLNSRLSYCQTELEVLKAENTSLHSKVRELGDIVETLKVDEEKYMNESSCIKTDIVELNETLGQRELELVKQKQTVIDLEASMSALNVHQESYLKDIASKEEIIKSHESIIEGLKVKCSEKEEDIIKLQKQFAQAKSEAEEKNRVLQSEADTSSGPILTPAEVMEKGQEIEIKEVQESMQAVHVQHRLETQKSKNEEEIDRQDHFADVTVELDRLRDQLKEKDNVISELQRNNASLLNMLDSRSHSSKGDSSLVEIHKLENEVRSMKMEREQMMDVLNDKTKECSNLKVEVQKLMSIISAEKDALEKLQKENQDLSRQTPESGSVLNDMQKETVKNLSRIIRDKDLEIESLKQKSETLLSVLQENSSEGKEMNSLMQDKENLTKQLATLQGEREQMITYLNQKHQESLAYHAEVQRLTTYINEELPKHKSAKTEYDNLVPQFEEKNQALLAAQNDLINYKQRYQELEVKYGHLVQQSETGETVDKTVYNNKVQEMDKLQERYKELMLNVEQKEAKIQNLHQTVSDLEQNVSTLDHDRIMYKKQVDNFNFQLHGLQTEQGDLRAEVTQLRQQKSEALSECQSTKEANQRLNLQLQETSFEVESLQEKSRSLTEMIQQGEKVQVQQVAQDTEATRRHLRQLQVERDQAVMKLQYTLDQQEQVNNEVQMLREKEAKLLKELDRLRQHLIEIEDGYTREALASEEREKDLRTRLAVAEETVLSSTSAVQKASQQTGEKLDSLQQQLAFVSQQRDQAYVQISSLQEQTTMYTSSMANLQMVLEQFQQEKDNLVAQETEGLQKQVARLTTEVARLQQDLKYNKEQLDEASDGLEAAARLSEQLDRKEEAIDALREEVQIREATLKAVEEELRKLKSRSDDRVDKSLIKNLFIGYFTTPQNQRRDVLRTIGGVLLFTADEFEKIENPNRGGWVPGFLRFGAAGAPKGQMSPPTTPRRSTVSGPPGRTVDNSFSEMFVKFLERESSPPPPTVRLPAEEMVKDVQKQKETQKPAYNPFTAPRHVAMPTSSPLTPGGSTNRHLLMSSAGSVAHSLPTFAAPSESSRTPPGSGRNTPATTTSGAILKDVLNR